MLDFRQTLLDIYSSRAADDVHKSRKYREMCEEPSLLENSAFNRLRHRIDMTKRLIESQVGREESLRAQIQAALRLISQYQPGCKQNECRELVRRTYGGFWSREQLEYFNRACDRLAAWSDFFLSFTNRNPTKNYINIVNRSHRFFIQDVLGPQHYNEANLSKTNLLAEVIYYLLINYKALRGFFCPEHAAEKSEIVERKLREACLSVFSFVQLVQSEMFVEYDGRRNFSHFEYENIQSRVDDIDLIFVLAELREDFLPEYRVLHDLQGWYRDVASRHVVELYHTVRSDPEAIDNNYEKIKKGVLRRVERAKAKLLENVPH